MSEDEVTRTIEIDAPPERAWDLISDLPRMGELSPENTGGRWIRGATGPGVGVRFRGANRRGGRRWTTDVVVTACEPGHTFAFDVASLGLPVARWRYDVSPRAGGCTVSEAWADRRGRAMRVIGTLVTGVRDRAESSADSMEQTLAALKVALERAEGSDVVIKKQEFRKK